MTPDFMLTSESVTIGHPDKLCDQVSDAIVDRFLEQDPFARIRAECAVAKGIVFIAARHAAKARVDMPEVARQVIKQAGYTEDGFDAKHCTIMTSLSELPGNTYHAEDERSLTDEQIDALPVENQVTVFGFACQQTPSLMPLPIWLAHRLARQLAAVRTDRRLSYLSPDGKAQVGVQFKNRKPDRIHSLTLIAASLKDCDRPPAGEMQQDLIENVILPVFEEEAIRPDSRTRIFVNPEGVPIGGGPATHSGLTGRKNAVDTYGEYSRHNGDALSGKDPMRIDRVGTYAARHAAKNVVAAGLAEECEVQLSYAIGLSRPVSVHVETFGTGVIHDDEIGRRLAACLDYRLGSIIRRFNLRRLPGEQGGEFYRRLAVYGHVGRIDLGVPWEATDAVQLLS